MKTNIKINSERHKKALFIVTIVEIHMLILDVSVRLNNTAQNIFCMT